MAVNSMSGRGGRGLYTRILLLYSVTITGILAILVLKAQLDDNNSKQLLLRDPIQPLFFHGGDGNVTQDSSPKIQHVGDAHPSSRNRTEQLLVSSFPSSQDKTMVPGLELTPMWVHFEKTLLRQNMLQPNEFNVLPSDGHPDTSSPWFSIEPTFLCRDKVLVSKFDEGVKWAICGLRRLDQRTAEEGGRCVSYSFGSTSERRHDFEAAVLRVVKRCETHVFDHNPKYTGGAHPYGIGTSDGVGKVGMGKATLRAGPNPPQMEVVLMTLESIMNSLKHTEVDILKIDIEGREFDVFDVAFQSGILERIGQIQIEVHWMSPEDKPNVIRLFDQFHRSGFAVFHKETDLSFLRGTEFSLIKLPQMKYLFQPKSIAQSGNPTSEFFDAYVAVHKHELATCGRTIVYKCADDFDDCGGVGDRTTGMLTTAAIAILTNRAFFVHVDEYDAVFQPRGGIDWTYTQDVAKCVTQGAKTYNFVNDIKLLTDQGENLNLDLILPDPHIIMHSNRGYLQQLLKHPNYGPILVKHGFSETNIFANFFEHMFQPTEGLLNAVKVLMPWDDSPDGTGPTDPLTISLHLRTGDHSFVGDVSDVNAAATRNDVFKLDKWLGCAQRVAYAALPMWGIVGPNSTKGKVKYVVYTDSKVIRDTIHTRQQSNTSDVMSDVLTSKYEPVHINKKEYIKYRQDYGNTPGFRTNLIQTYAEWYAYSRGNIFITDLVSGFSGTSLWSTLGSRDPQFSLFGIVDPSNCMPYSSRFLQFSSKGAGI